MTLPKGKKRLVLIFFVFAVVCLVLIFAVVFPMTKKVYQQKDLLEEAKLTLKRDQENIDKYKSDLDYLRDNAFLSEGLVIDEDRRVILIEELENTAVEEDLDLKIEVYIPTAAAQKASKKNNEPEKTLLKLSVNGDYDNLLTFLYKLQNFKYVVSIDNLTIERFDESKIKSLQGEISLSDLPEIEAEIVISFRQ